ncbi:hypothetical protein GQR58_019691 [Nymphon striatum]|nr:hypothetical protein GQR58_019691 [Nymphon striatum]
MKKLDQSSDAHGTAHFDVSKHIRLVPPFQENNVDLFFLHLEKIAITLKWPKENWSLLLQSVLIGRAREIYSQLSIEQSSSYDFVKESILCAYELVPEAYRQNFRNSTKETHLTYLEFSRSKEFLFDKWCKAKNTNNDYFKLKQLILLEDFKNCIHPNVKTYIDEQKVETLDHAARLADDYYLTHKSSFINKPLSQTTQNFSFKKPFDSKDKQVVVTSASSLASSKTQSNDKSFSSKPFSTLKGIITCNYCKKKGHLMSECFSLKRKQEKEEHKPAGFTSSWSNPTSHIDKNAKDKLSQSDHIMKTFQPFISDGFISLSSDFSEAIPIKILRDTGASQSLILASTLPFSEETFSGNSVLIQGVDCSKVASVRLHNVHLTSDLVSGPVTIGIRSFLPFPGIHLLLGNDLAGGKVEINPLVTDKPSSTLLTDLVENSDSNLYPACAVTRAMTLKHSNPDVDFEKGSANEINLSDSFINKIFQADKFYPSNEHSLSKLKLVEAQMNDPEISNLFERVVDDVETSIDPICYFTKNGILLRKYRLSKACNFAHSNLKSVQSKMKSRYDKNTTVRSFSVGDKVLSLLPIPGSSLQAKYHGPYTIDKRLSELNYIINTPDRRKSEQLCHINMLKPYIDRSNHLKSVGIVNSCHLNNPSSHNAGSDEDCFKNFNFYEGLKLENSSILDNLICKFSPLSRIEQNQLCEIIFNFKNLFSDVPTLTTKIVHDVDVDDAIPVKQNPYRINHIQPEYSKKEIVPLPQHNFIGQGSNNWNSLCRTVSNSNWLQTQDILVLVLCYSKETRTVIILLHIFHGNLTKVRIKLLLNCCK